MRRAVFGITFGIVATLSQIARGDWVAGETYMCTPKNPNDSKVNIIVYRSEGRNAVVYASPLCTEVFIDGLTGTYNNRKCLHSHPQNK